MISAFGQRAAAYARGLGDLEAIVTDLPSLPLAYCEAVRRREIGEPFYGMVDMPDQRSQVIATAGRAILDTFPDDDRRRRAFEHLGAGALKVNDTLARDLFALDPSTRQALFEFQLLCDAMLVRSFAEHARLSQVCQRPRPFERVVMEPAVPAVRRRLPQRPSVVVWAPDSSADQIAPYAFGLVEFLGDVLVISGTPERPFASNLVWTTREDPIVLDALAVAACVMTVDSADPGAAVAFARRGYGVAAPDTSGAHEYVRNVQTFDVGRLRSIHVAVSTAIGSPAEPRELPPHVPRAPLRPPFLIKEQLPLVSVVIPTYNRPADLRNCLRYAAEQTYKNIEAVVVNDAGENVDHVVAEFPFARVINLEHNQGTTAAEMTGIRAAKGSYIQLAADDDCMYPDHIELLLQAMVRCGAHVGHTNGLIRQQRRMPDGGLLTDGYNAGIFMDTSTPSEALISTPINPQALLFRRDVFEEIGPWHPESLLADQEYILRAANHYVLVYVDLTTNEWRVRDGESYFSKFDMPQEMRKLFLMHPTPNRPLINEIREVSIQRAASRSNAPGPRFPPTVRIEPGSVPGTV